MIDIAVGEWYTGIMKVYNMVESDHFIQRHFYNESSSQMELVGFGWENYANYKVFSDPVVHSTRYHSLHLAVKGCGTLTINGITYPITEGTFFLCPADTPLYYVSDPNDPYAYYWFDFTGKCCNELFERMQISADTPIYITSNLKYYETLLRELLSVPCDSLSLDLYALSYFYQILSAIINERNLQPTPKISAKESLVTQVVSYLQYNFTFPDLTIEGLARMVHVSHSYLCRIFKECTGQSMAAYLTSLRLKKAVALFASTNYSLLDISMMVGYSDYPNFTKLFKKFTGQSPSIFRKKSDAC